MSVCLGRFMEYTGVLPTTQFVDRGALMTETIGIPPSLLTEKVCAPVMHFCVSHTL